MPVLLKIIIASLLINNVVIMRFIALCPYIGITSNLTNSIAMSLAVIFVMVLANSATWSIYHYVFMPFGIEFLQIIVFTLIIASLVQLVELYLKKCSPALYMALGIYLPLMATNCAIFAVTFDTITYGYTFIESVMFSLGASAGFMLAMILLAGLRQRIRTSAIPSFLRGNPILFVLSSLIATAFMGFAGLV